MRNIPSVDVVKSMLVSATRVWPTRSELAEVGHEELMAAWTAGTSDFGDPRQRPGEVVQLWPDVSRSVATQRIVMRRSLASASNAAVQPVKPRLPLRAHLTCRLR